MLLLLLLLVHVASAVALLVSLLFLVPLLLLFLFLLVDISGGGAVAAAQLLVVVVIIIVFFFTPASPSFQAPLPRLPRREDVRLVQPRPVFGPLVPARESQGVVVDQQVVFGQNVAVQAVGVAARSVDEELADGVGDLDGRLGVRDVELVAPLEGVLLRVP